MLGAMGFSKPQLRYSLDTAPDGGIVQCPECSYRNWRELNELSLIDHDKVCSGVMEHTVAPVAARHISATTGGSSDKLIFCAR